MSSPVAHPNQALASWSPAQLGVVGDVLEVVRAPHPVLATEGAEVDPLDPVMVAMAADLVATMRVSPGCVGLAAPQVGVAAQMFALDVTGHPKTRTCHGVFVLCNAVIVEASRQEKAREGCMSVPDLTGDVKRATRLTVTGRPTRYYGRGHPDHRRLRSPRHPTRNRPLRRRPLPGPRGRRPRHLPAKGLPVGTRRWVLPRTPHPRTHVAPPAPSCRQGPLRCASCVGGLWLPRPPSLG